MTKRTIRSEEEWRQLLLKFEQSSSVPVKDFLEEHGLATSMLYTARKRFKLKHERGDKRNLAKLDVGEHPAEESAPTRKSKYPPELREKSIALYKQGITSAAEIAKQLGAPKALYMIRYWIATYRKDAGLANGAGSAAPAETKRATDSAGAGARAAITLLRQMEKELMRLIRQNKIEAPDGAHLLAQMALRALTGDQ